LLDGIEEEPYDVRILAPQVEIPRSSPRPTHAV
jgi:hypothetical protein